MTPRVLPSLLVSLALLSLASAQQIAFDNAPNYPTSSGGGTWNDGDNFGFGFRPWDFLVVGRSGALFLGNSTQNGGEVSVVLCSPLFGENGSNSRHSRAFLQCGFIATS